MRSPEHVAWSTEIRAVPFKKTPKSSLTYLDKPEIDALLKAPDLRTAQGSRDYALLLFLYNTGARVEEAAHLTIDAITWSSSPAVRLVGKGNKTRSCPIWKRTVDVLKPLVAGRNAQEFVFLNRLDEPLTRFGIYSLVRRAVDQASRTLPSIATKRIAPLYSTFVCGPFASLRRGHQYHPGVARARLLGHHAHLRGGRPGNESESTRALRSAK